MTIIRGVGPGPWYVSDGISRATLAEAGTHLARQIGGAVAQLTSDEAAAADLIAALAGNAAAIRLVARCAPYGPDYLRSEITRTLRDQPLSHDSTRALIDCWAIAAGITPTPDQQAASRAAIRRDYGITTASSTTRPSRPAARRRPAPRRR